ncbi:MAG: site-2 protease family protein, partial [Planctomycetota bacterium]
PAFLLYLTNGAYVFGSAKPVPVDFTRLRHRWRDMALVAAAGPGANILIAVCSGLLLRILMSSGLFTPEQRVDELLKACLWSNVFLAVFNLLPVPPLDGSRIVTWLLPRRWRDPYQAIGIYGILITLIAMRYVPLFSDTVYGVSMGLGHLISWGTGIRGA